MVDRDYLKLKILELAEEKNLIDACKKIELFFSIPYYVLYNFTRKSVPKEENLLKIIVALNLDANKLFVKD